MNDGCSAAGMEVQRDMLRAIAEGVTDEENRIEVEWYRQWRSVPYESFDVGAALTALADEDPNMSAQRYILKAVVRAIDEERIVVNLRVNAELLRKSRMSDVERLRAPITRDKTRQMNVCLERVSRQSRRY